MTTMTDDQKEKIKESMDKLKKITPPRPARWFFQSKQEDKKDDEYDERRDNK